MLTLCLCFQRRSTVRWFVRLLKSDFLSLEVFCERQFKWNDPLLTSDRNLGIKKKDLWKAWILWLHRWWQCWLYSKDKSETTCGKLIEVNQSIVIFSGFEDSSVKSCYFTGTNQMMAKTSCSVLNLDVQLVTSCGFEGK